jgi:hypothetical protein
MAHDRVQVHAAVRLVTVQVECHAGHGDLHADQRHQRAAPEPQVQNSVE